MHPSATKDENISIEIKALTFIQFCEQNTYISFLKASCKERDENVMIYANTQLYKKKIQGT